MNATDYQKLAKHCNKHLRALHIALDGVVKAETAGQQWLVGRSVQRAQQCLAQVCTCFDGCADESLVNPLVELDRALAVLEDGERAQLIERSIREFEAAFEAKQQAPAAATKNELAYTASLRRRSTVAPTISR